MFAWQCALLVEHLAVVVELLLGVEGLLRGLHVQLGLLDILRQSSVYAGAVSSFGLLVRSLVVEFGGREVAVFQFGEQLSFMYLLRPRDVELSNWSINFGRD